MDWICLCAETIREVVRGVGGNERVAPTGGTSAPDGFIFLNPPQRLTHSYTSINSPLIPPPSLYLPLSPPQVMASLARIRPRLPRKVVSLKFPLGPFPNLVLKEIRWKSVNPLRALPIIPCDLSLSTQKLWFILALCCFPWFANLCRLHDTHSGCAPLRALHCPTP